MNVPGFNDREKALEDEYIRRKEAEKFAQKTGTQPVQQPGGQGQSSQGNPQGASQAK